jgi:AmpD protein
MTTDYPSNTSLAPISTARPLRVNADGWVETATQMASPNYDARSDTADISLLVVHNISLPPGEFGTGCVQQFFCNQLDHSAHPFFREIDGVRVSSHFFIDRQGVLTQFVATIDRAWHAGLSSFEGRDVCNDYSVGIELEGTDDQPYTGAQYQTLQELTQALMCRHPEIGLDRITGHSDIAPGRKTDPGPAFDWSRYKAGLRSADK